MSAKFGAPPARPWAVTRQRLLDRISAGAGGPLTLITAPAGSGKTALVGSWVAAGAAPGPLAWLSLDDRDGQPGVFWSYVLAGLARAGVPVADVGMPARPDEVEDSIPIRLAAVLSEQPRPVVLVLDDTHLLAGSPAARGLDFLLRHAAPQLRVIMSGRVEPELPLHRYRLAGSVAELRLDELAFTLPEAGALLAAHGVELPGPDVAALVSRTKGWAAGIRLAALCLQRRPYPGSDGAGVAIEREIEEYFVAEVLDAQPAGVRDFLLHTSVADRVWPELAAELTGRRDAGRMLSRLARGNVFLAPSPVDRGAYECPPVVRDALRSKLRHEAPRRKVAQLHHRAACWLAAEQRFPAAIAHAAAAADWSYAAALAIDGLVVDRLLAGPAAGEPGEALAGIPADLPGPAAAVVRAALAAGRGAQRPCAQELGRARELVGSSADEDTPALRLSAAVTEAACARVRGEPESMLRAVTAAELAMANLREQGRAIPPNLAVLVHLQQGAGLLARGDLDGAATALAAGAGVDAGVDAGDTPWLLGCLGQLSLVEALRGRLRLAARYADQATAAAAARRAGRSAAVEVALAWTAVEEYDLRRARAGVERAAEVVNEAPDTVAAALLGVARARLLRARGDTGGAMASIGAARSAVDGRAPGWLLDKLSTVELTIRAASGTPERIAAVPDLGVPASPQAALAVAAVQLARGATAEAADRVAGVLAQGNLAVDASVEAWLLSATCELARGKTEHAKSALGRALRLAEAERLRRPVLEAPPQLRRFLRQDGELIARHGWLGATELTAGRPSGRGGPAASTGGERAPFVVEPLTAKETEVLRHLAALLSTEEIARRMFVSVNTIKTHIRGVLRKLAASRRNEAIRRARELGLV